MSNHSTTPTVSIASNTYATTTAIDAISKSTYGIPNMAIVIITPMYTLVELPIFPINNNIFVYSSNFDLFLELM